MDQNLIVVNENNEVVKIVDSVEVHHSNLLHRSVHVIVVGKGEKFFCRQISSTSSLYANYWSTATGAHILANHEPLETAQYSLKDLLGISMDLEFIGDVRINDGVENEISSTYVGYYDGIFNLNKSKLTDGKFFTDEELSILFESEKVTPHLVKSIELYRKIK
ncbi:MAG: hypothetical protein WCV69_03195 [Patescibacteria group bacterium]|jgi:isopentenyl-diphosphate delta-isomerase